MSTGLRSGLLRDRRGEQRVGVLELFFDLVYVFAVTQLSHGLLEHLSWSSAVQTLLLTMAVWTAWMYTTWITNWFDPERIPVMGVILGVMFGSLVLSVTIPDAFGGRGLGFALAYVLIQTGRTAFCIWALRGHLLRRNFVRNLCWFGFTSIFWVVGAFLESDWRIGVWIVAIVLESIAAFVGFAVPGLGSTRTLEWTVSIEHLVERSHLFVIIVLGESIIISGGTFSDGPITPIRTAAFITAFLGAAAFWWIHFLRSRRLSRKRSDQTDAGRFSRTLSYAIVPTIVGLIVSAVADELVIAHPSGHAETAWLVVIAGGPAIFLAGQALLTWALAREVPRSCLGGLLGIAVAVPFFPSASPLGAAVTITVILIAVAAVDTAGDWPFLNHGSLGETDAMDTRLDHQPTG